MRHRLKNRAIDLVAGLTRITRDVGAAEDLAHDALVAALEQWPTEGVPSNPGARVSASGEPILMLEQNRALWDELLIHRGLAALARAEELSRTMGSFGPYTPHAAIAACHARALTADATDWRRIAALYSALAHVAPSPIVELNRAVAVSMAEGPAAGLTIVDAIADDPALKSYHLLPSVRGDLLRKLGRVSEARAEFERAAALTQNTSERDLLLSRAASCASSPSS